MRVEVYFGSVQPGQVARFAVLAAKVDKIAKLLDLPTIEERDKGATWLG